LSKPRRRASRLSSSVKSFVIGFIVRRFAPTRYSMYAYSPFEGAYEMSVV
jgi:hypothetical protein